MSHSSVSPILFPPLSHTFQRRFNNTIRSPSGKNHYSFQLAARNPRVLLNGPPPLLHCAFIPPSFHPFPAWSIFLEIPLDSITSMLCPPLPGPSYYLGCPHSYSRPNYNSISSPPFKVLHTRKAELALDMIWLSLLSIHYIWNLIDTLQYFPALLY